ncbi:MAG: sensor domain-containing protein [Anaerolineae bacterium]
MDENTSWVDVITDGRIWRSLLYLLWTFFSGIGYLTFLSAGFGTAFGLSFILIGIPLLVLMFAGSRGLADFDRRLSGVFLDKPVLPLVNDIPRAQSIFRRLGSLLGSPTSWLSIVYLLTRFPAGMFAMMALPIITPLLLLEVLILAPLGVTRGTISLHVVNGLANGIASFSNSLLPSAFEETRPPRSSEKSKRDMLDRDTTRLQIIDEDEGYYLDDEGEIVNRRRKRG